MSVFKEQITDYIAYCDPCKKLSPKTLKAYSIDLKQYCSFMANLHTYPRKADLLDFIALLHKQYKPKTAKRKIASIKAFYRYLEYEELIGTNPMAQIHTKFQEPRLLPRIVSIETIKNILHTSYKRYEMAKTEAKRKTALRDIAIIELLFATGMRVSELCSLMKDNIDLHNGVIRIIGKGSKERVLQISNSEVLSALVQYNAERNAVAIEYGSFFTNRLHSPISEQSVRFMIKKICKEADISQNITPHMFRHV